MRGTSLAASAYTQSVMQRKLYKFITLLLALLVASTAWLPLPARAEVQMRCVGASPQSAPCAHADLPAAGLTETKVYGALMSCCRSMRDHCPMSSHREASSKRASLSAPLCRVSLRIAASVPSPRALRRVLNGSFAPAYPLMAFWIVQAVPTANAAPWRYTPVLSPHAAPALHGLRAPPSA